MKSGFIDAVFYSYDIIRLEIVFVVFFIFYFFVLQKREERETTVRECKNVFQSIKYIRENFLQSPKFDNVALLPVFLGAL